MSGTTPSAMNPGTVEKSGPPGVKPSTMPTNAAPAYMAAALRTISRRSDGACWELCAISA